MSTFDLSLAVRPNTAGDVKPSKLLEKKFDPKQHQMVEQTVTDGAIGIDKANTASIKLDGPLGHMYTELLNRELSMESMGSVVAAAATTSNPESDQFDTGKVSMTTQGPIVDTPDNQGYIYIVPGDQLEQKDLANISSKLLERRLAQPDTPIGLAMLTEGNPSPTMESLTRCLAPSGIKTTFLKSGLTAMAKSMLGGK